MSSSLSPPLADELAAPAWVAVQEGLCGLARALHAGATQDCARVREEISQVKGLSTHAIVALQSTFSELEQLVRQQRDSMDALLAPEERDLVNVQPQVSIASFVGEVAPLCRSLTDLMGRIVGRNSESARRAEVLTSDVTKTVQLLRRFEAVESKTFALGRDATREASRAGQHGREFAAVAQEVRTLATLSKELNEEIGAQLGRTQLALGHVRESLVDSAATDVDGAGESRERVDELLEKLGALDKRLSFDLEKMKSVSRQVTERVAMALQALQFEDLMAQLLDCVVKRVDRIDASLGSLQPLGEAAAESRAALAGLLKTGAEVIAEHYRVAIESPVSQVDISSGSVDFF